MIDSPTRWMRWSAPGWRSTALAWVAWIVLAAVGGALFPRLGRWMRWRQRLSLRGRLIYAGASAALAFALRELAHRSLQSREDLIAELRDELGREPTSAEVQRRLGRDIARDALHDHLGREPTEQELQDFLRRAIPDKEGPVH